MKWHSVGDMTGGPWPTPRGGAVFIALGDMAFLHGGYSKTADGEEEGMEHGNTLEGSWKLDLKTYQVGVGAVVGWVECYCSLSRLPRFIELARLIKIFNNCQFFFIN